MGFRLQVFSRLIYRRCGCSAVLQRRVSKMEKGASSIVSTFKQALATFNPKLCKTQEEFNSRFESLKAMMNSLRTSDVGLDETLLQLETWDAPDKAPCTYIELFENEHMNMSIFILRPGFRMPLHDHPHMHGLLKVVSGTVRLRAFSKRDLLKEAGEAGSSTIPISRHTSFAQVMADTVINEESNTCIVTPNEANLHEIEALDLPAAFLDILAPPYDTLIENIGPRRCSYYRISQQISRNLVQLEEIRPPSWFYCDQAPYLGPLLV